MVLGGRAVVCPSCVIVTTPSVTGGSANLHVRPPRERRTGTIIPRPSPWPGSVAVIPAGVLRSLETSAEFFGVPPIKG